MYPSLAFLENLGFGELVIVMIIALLLFGERLPNVARSFGKGYSEFKRSMRDSTEQVKREMEAAAGPIMEPMKEFKRELNSAATDAMRTPDALPQGFNENKLDPSIQNCEETPATAVEEKLPAHGAPIAQPPDSAAVSSTPAPSTSSSVEAKPVEPAPAPSVPTQSCAPVPAVTVSPTPTTAEASSIKSAETPKT